MNEPVRIAVVGISGFGVSLLDSLLHSGAGSGVRHQVIGVIDPAADRCRLIGTLHERRCPIFPSLESFLADGPEADLVVLATPIYLHASQTCAALEAGASVMCEKPLAGGLSDARKVIEAAKAAKNRFVAVGYQWSFSRAVQRLKRDVMAGRFGRPRRLRTWVDFPRGLDYFSRAAWVGRTHTDDGREVFDSPVNNATAHYLHNMLYVLGRTPGTSATPRSVQAELYRANAIENFDTAALRCVMDDEAELLFYTSHAVPERTGPRCIFEFDDATVTYDDNDGRRFIARFVDGTIEDYGRPEDDRDEKLWQSIKAVRTGQPIVCGPEAALPHVLVAATARESAGAVTPVPSAACHLVEQNSGPMICVDGLPQALRDSFDRGILPAELGALPWATPGSPVTISDQMA